MTSPLKPPRGLFVPGEVIFDSNLAPSLRDTLIQLLALAWQAQGHSTPLLSYEVLTALTGKSKRTLQGHIAALRNNHAALRLQIAGSGEFIVLFDPRLWTTHRRRKNLHSPVKEDKESLKEFNYTPSPPPDVLVKTRNKSLLESGRRAKNCAAAADPRTHNLEPGLTAELLSAGVYPGLLSEIEDSGLTPEMIRALLAWSYVDNPDRPGGLFMARLRIGATPPKHFTQAPCSQCGQVGEHAPDCYMRYLDSADLQQDADLEEV
jgi:hypothetical protein